MREPLEPTEATKQEHLGSHLKFGDVFSLLKEAGSEWVEDRVPRLSAALAYYTLLSLAPLLVVAVAIAAIAFGKKAVEGQLFWQIQGLVGKEGASAVQELLRNADRARSGFLATTVGLVILLFAASTVVIELEDALNTIWHVASPASAGGWSALVTLFKDRVYSFTMILGTGLLLLISLLLNTVLSLVASFFNSLLPVPAPVLGIVEFALAFGVTTILFAAIYKFIPAVRLMWSDVLVGAIVTSLFFTIGKQLIGFYLGKEGFGSTYGAAGSLVAVLVWVYYSAQLFFLGAEFTKVYTKRFGSQRGTSQ